MNLLRYGLFISDWIAGNIRDLRFQCAVDWLRLALFSTGCVCEKAAK
jgi:hypothetical protein